MNGKTALLDSNIIIYIAKGDLSFDSILSTHNDFQVSIITYMEVLGFHFVDPREKILVENLFSNIKIVKLDDYIVDTVIKIKQNHKIKLPHAIILATSIVYNYDLITANIRDFENI